MCVSCPTVLRPFVFPAFAALALANHTTYNNNHNKNNNLHAASRGFQLNYVST